MVDGKDFDFHLLPSGIINEKCISIIGEYCALGHEFEPTKFKLLFFAKFLKLCSQSHEFDSQKMTSFIAILMQPSRIFELTSKSIVIHKLA